jgi:hypothetical protein
VWALPGSAETSFPLAKKKNVCSPVRSETGRSKDARVMGSARTSCNPQLINHIVAQPSWPIRDKNAIPVMRLLLSLSYAGMFALFSYLIEDSRNGI